ncbi:MAG: pyridoxal-phosphate dependent enzyme [Planctomycetaceae bacterium]
MTVSEDEIIEAMRFIWTRMKLIIEPSSAVAVAAVRKDRDRLSSQQVGIIISGGNVDLNHLPGSNTPLSVASQTRPTRIHLCTTTS